MQTILITGGAGFIGSNFIPFFLEANANYKVVNLDLLTYAGDLQNLKGVEENFRYTFVKGDICDRSFVENLFRSFYREKTTNNCSFQEGLHMVFMC